MLSIVWTPSQEFRKEIREKYKLDLLDVYPITIEGVNLMFKNNILTTLERNGYQDEMKVIEKKMEHGLVKIFVLKRQYDEQLKEVTV